jgi:hypothetical protein
MILGIDPSGNFNEGKGTTGWCLLIPGTNKIIKTGDIKAKDFDSANEYWQAHVDLIKNFNKSKFFLSEYNDLDAEEPINKTLYGPGITVSMEDYLLYSNKSRTQVNSKFETIQLIGIIKHNCWLNNIKLKMRNAGQVKKRWSNKILRHKEYIVKYSNGHATYINPSEQINRHILDSIRHAVHYDVLESKKESD